MILFVHAAPATLEAHRRPNLGVLSSPRRWYRDIEGWPWAADNDGFSAWHPERFREMLDGIANLRPPPIFVTAPDVVADAEATLERFEEWQPIIAAYGLRVAFVAQDGLAGDDRRVPWDDFAALFIGGSTEFKLGPIAAELVATGKKLGKWIHVGRVNSPPRMAYCASIGADSVDGSTHNRFRNIYLDRGVISAGAPPQGRLTL